MMWLFNTTENVVRNVPKVAEATTKMRPQSVRPKRSARLAMIAKRSSKGSTLTVSSMRRPTS
jgi:hypothetical protein